MTTQRSSLASLEGRVAATVGTNLGLALVALVTGPLVARLLGPAGRGELAAIQVWAPLLAALAMAGLPEALVYFGVRKPERIGTYLLSGLPAALVIGLPIIGLAYLALPWLLSTQSPETVSAARWYLLFIPLSTVLRMLVESLLGRRDYVAWNTMRFLPNFSWLLLVGAAFLAGWSSATRVASAYLLVLAALAVLTFVVVKGRLGPLTWSYEPALARPMLAYGLPSVGGGLPGWVSVRLDQLVLASVLAPAELGVYVVAVSWGGVTLPLLRGVGLVILPEVARFEAREERRAAVMMSVRAGMLLALLLSAAFLVVTPVVIPFLFGREFAGAVPIALILVLAGGLQGLNFVLQQVVRATGRTLSLLPGEIAGAAVMAAGLLLLLRPLGMTGAAVSSALGSLVATAILCVIISRQVSCSLAALVLPRRKDFAFLARRLRQVRHSLLGAGPGPAGD